VHRRYDVPATPYQRLLASGQLSQAARESLQQRYASLNPIQLRQQIEQRQNELLRTLRRSETRPDSARKLTPVRLPEEMRQSGFRYLGSGAFNHAWISHSVCWANLAAQRRERTRVRRG